MLALACRRNIVRTQLIHSLRNFSAAYNEDQIQEFAKQKLNIDYKSEVLASTDGQGTFKMN
jgi:hypothetical protein